MSTQHSPERPFHRIRALHEYLASVRGFDRNVKLVLTATAFRGMVIACLGTVLNLYLYSLGYDSRFIGLINAANSVAVLVVSVPIGYLADKIGRRAVMLAGGIGYPLTILGLTLSHSTPWILAFNFLFGAVSSAYWVSAVPLLYSSTHDRQRVQAFSVNSFLLWGIGPIGAFASGQIVEVAARVLHTSASSTAALRTGMFFMVALAVLGAIPYPFIRERKEVREVAREEVPPLRRLTGLFTRLLLPDLVLAFGIGSVLTFTQLYFHLRFSLDPGPIGIIMAIAGLVAGVGTLLTPLASRRWGNLQAAVRFQWMVVPPMAALAVSHVLGLSIPLYWLLLALRGMSDPVYTAFIQERVPETYRSRISGFYSVTYSIGFSLGPTVSGALQKAGGFTVAFLVGTALYFLGASLLYLFFWRNRDAPNEARAAA